MKFLLTVTLFLFVAFMPFKSLHAQEEGGADGAANGYTNIMPPAPTAGELGKYGSSPRAMATGIPAIDIPLFAFSTNTLSVPVSLSYHSDGIKVDQTASWVGLGWSLNAGGVVTRVIKGMPDDEDRWPSYPAKITERNAETLEYMYRAGKGTIDTEPDLFSFNFMGYSGKFVFDRDGHAQIMPHQNLIITRTENHETGASEVKIITPDGVQYFFGGIGATETSFQKGSSTSCGKVPGLQEETAWYLNKAIHPQGESIEFTYTPYNYHFDVSISQTYRINRQEEGTCMGSCSPGGDPQTCTYTLYVQGVRLSGISSLNYGSISFISSLRQDIRGEFKLDQIELNRPGGEVYKTFHFGYEYSTNPRLFLMSLTEKSPGADINIKGGQNKVHTFEYEDKNSLPPRLSFSRDHWGYFNGVNNEYLFPKDKIREFAFGDVGGNREPNAYNTKKGILKKVTYPTGGNTQYIYEQNTVYEDVLVKDNDPKTVNPSTQGGDGPVGINTVYERTVSIPEDQEVLVVGGYSYNPERAGDDPLELGCEEVKASSMFWILNVTDNIYEVKGQPTKNFRQKIKLRANKIYEVKVRVTGFCTNGSVTFTYNDDKSYITQANVIKGGLRIGKVINYDHLSGVEEVTKFHYGALATLNQSSGKLAVKPDYFYFAEAMKKVPCAGGGGGACEITCTDWVLYSSSQNDLNGNGTGHMAYQYVTISKGGNNFENGGEEYTFFVSHNNQNGNIKGDNVLGTPYTNYNWNHSMEEKVRKFKMSSSGQPVVLYEKINNYVPDPAHYVEVPALVVKKRFEGGCDTEVRLVCDGIDRVLKRWVCKTNHDHHLSLSPLWDGWMCTKGGSYNVKEIVWASPCNGKDSETVYYSLDDLNVMEYINISYWYYLDNTTEHFFDDNGMNALTKSTTYQYGNPAHLNLTSISSQNSQNEKTETTYQYPDDFSVAQVLPLKEKHIVNLPVVTKKMVNGNQVDGKVISYNEFGQPVEIYQYSPETLKAPLPHDPSVINLTDHTAEARLSYHDVSRRLKQVDKGEVPQTVILWGYSNTKPIAEVKNASFSRVFHSSFEETGTLNPGAARTGNRYYNSGSFYIPSAGFTTISTANLKMSYWFWDGSRWVFSGEVPYNNQITSPGTRLDEVRVYPEGALMTTYTYDLPVGVSTVTDANGSTTYYQYDPMNRLQFVKDQDGNILNRMDYNYQVRD